MKNKKNFICKIKEPYKCYIKKKVIEFNEKSKILTIIPMIIIFILFFLLTFITRFSAIIKEFNVINVFKEMILIFSVSFFITLLFMIEEIFFSFIQFYEDIITFDIGKPREIDYDNISRIDINKYRNNYWLFKIYVRKELKRVFGVSKKEKFEKVQSLIRNKGIELNIINIL